MSHNVSALTFLQDPFTDDSIIVQICVSSPIWKHLNLPAFLGAFEYLLLTAALHHGTWSRLAGQTDLYVAWISREIQYEFHTHTLLRLMKGKKHKNDTKLKEMHSTRGCAAFKCVTLVWKIPDQVLLPTIEPGWSGTEVPSGQRLVANSQKCQSSSVPHKDTPNVSVENTRKDWRESQGTFRYKLHWQRKKAWSQV